MIIRGSITVGIVALMSALAIGACGGSDSNDNNDVEAATGGTSGDDDVEEGPVGYPCSDNGMDAFSDLVTDFSVTTASGENFNWGASDALTGGTFSYDNVPDDGTSVITLSVVDEALNVAGNVEEYGGFGLWFGPCLNAATYAGISFTVSGDLGNSELVLQVQTSKNYPADDSASKGECEGDWNSCVSNSFVIVLAATADDPAQGEVISVPWADLTGGLPIEGLDGSELLGIQWQFNCASGEVCTPNITIDDVKFMTE